MIDGLKPYPKRKNSGVPWLGEVPEHWESRRLKHWVGMNTIVLPEATPPEYEFRYLDIGSVGTGVLSAKPQRLRFATAPSRARRVLREGDTIVSTVRTYLKAVYLITSDSDDLVCSTGFAVLTPKAGTTPKFVYYLCQSSPFTARVMADSVGIAYPAIPETRLAAFPVPLPPLAEQVGIVRFLDHADRRIRRYLRAKSRLIHLLEEQKQAIVHRAVTRGLDPNVRLKPSGVEWLGEVPEHWEVGSLRHFITVKSGDAPQRGNHEGGPHAVFGANGIIGRSSAFNSEAPRVVVGRVGSAGAVNVTPGKVWITDNVLIVDPRSRAISFDFLPRLLAALDLPMLASQSAQPLITGGQIKARTAAIPPLVEQAAIVGFLEAATARLTQAVESAHREIALLREYRTRLIADVVTGKLDVREAAARLPEETGEDEPLDNLDPDEDSTDPADGEPEETEE